MSALCAARMGAMLGLCCGVPVALWLAPFAFGVAGAPADGALVSAFRALLVAQAVALALAAPCALAARLDASLAGCLLLVLAPLPLVAALVLAGGGSPRSAVWGLAMLLAWGAAAAALGALLRRGLRDADGLRLGGAALELGLVVLVFGLREQWLGWASA